MRKRTPGKAPKAPREDCVVRAWLRQAVRESDYRSLGPVCVPCALCVSLGLVKPKVER
jgi:hypothetical protein